MLATAPPQHRRQAKRLMMYVTVALLAFVATVCGQPVDDGYGPGMPMSGGPTDSVGGATPSLQSGKSKLCPEPIWDKNGKCNQAAFEKCARKVVKAYNDGYVYLTNLTQLIDHYTSFILPSSMNRVTPFGTFPGDRAPEYAGMYAIQGGQSSFFGSLRYTVRRFVARCPLVAATVDVHLVNQLNKKFANATYEEWFRLDKATSRIATFDIDILRYQELTTALGAPADIKASPQLYLGVTQSAICGAHTKYCTGALQQYDSEADCKAFIAAIPLVDFSTMAGNTTYCRYLHSSFMTLEPAVHCAHIGKNSATCRDVAYDSYYQDTRFNAPTFLMGGKF